MTRNQELIEKLPASQALSLIAKVSVYKLVIVDLQE